MTQTSQSFQSLRRDIANPTSSDVVAQTPADIPLSSIATMSREDFAALFPAASSALQGMAQAVLKSEVAS